MNMINKLLILLIILFLINHLTNNKLVDSIKLCFNMYGSKPKNIKNNKAEELFYLYRYLNNLIAPTQNIQMVRSPDKRLMADESFEAILIYHLNKILNNRDYKFNNIKLLNKIYYYDNQGIIDIEPFNIKANISYQDVQLDNLVIYIESFFRKNNGNDFLTFTNIRLLDGSIPNYNQIEPSISVPTNIPTVNKQQPSKHEAKAIEDNHKLTMEMKESFNNHFVNRDNFNDLFIKPTETYNKTEGYINDTDNSLIPTIDNISESSSSN